MKVQNKVIVVTGGGSGIGRELVLNLLAKGAAVAAADVNEDAVQETARLAADHATKLSTYVLNVVDRAAVLAFPDEVIAAHGAVDGLINNAGIIQPFVRVNDLDFAAIERVMNVNFYGLLNMTKAFLPHLLKRPQAHIVNISSMGGFLPVPGQTIYGASKAAAKLLTEGLQSELINTNVAVSVVFPGAIGTNITANSGVATPGDTQAAGRRSIKLLPPTKAAQIIIEGMEKNRARILVGSDSSFLDKFYRTSPQRAAQFIAKQMQSFLSNP